jgi:hypothetical protein
MIAASDLQSIVIYSMQRALCCTRCAGRTPGPESATKSAKGTLHAKPTSQLTLSSNII